MYNNGRRRRESGHLSNLQQIIFLQVQAPVYNIFYDSGIQSVVMEWSGYATSAQFKEGTRLMLKTLVENRACKVLASIKDMVLISMEDQRWLESVFLPQAIKHGFRALAILRPDNYFNKVAVETVSYKVDKEKLTINFFDNLDEAREWLTGL